MEFYQFIKSKRQTLVAFLMFFLVIGGTFTFVQTFKYSTKSQLLVIQEGSGGVDPFAVSRSVEYLSTLFSKIVYSNSFFNLVLNSKYNIDKSYFDGDSTEQMKIWKKTVSAKSVENSGIINISIYHPSGYQAKQIATAVNDVLINQNANYQGIGTSVKVTIIDEPIVSNYPDQPSLSVNFSLIVALSFIFGFMYIYVFPEEKYNIYIFGKRKKKVRAVNYDFAKTAPSVDAEKHQNMDRDDYEHTNLTGYSYDPEKSASIKNILK